MHLSDIINFYPPWNHKKSVIFEGIEVNLLNIRGEIWRQSLKE